MNRSYVEFGKDHEYTPYYSHAAGTTFDLTEFFQDDWADCRDMSAVVHVFTRAIGGTATQVKQILGQFYYKPILPIGWSIWTDEDEEEDKWNYHQIAWESNVYDACLKLKKSDPYIPINKDIDNPYKIDLYDEGYWNPTTAFNYTSVE